MADKHIRKTELKQRKPKFPTSVNIKQQIKELAIQAEADAKSFRLDQIRRVFGVVATCDKQHYFFVDTNGKNITQKVYGLFAGKEIKKIKIKDQTIEKLMLVFYTSKEKTHKIKIDTTKRINRFPDKASDIGIISENFNAKQSIEAKECDLQVDLGPRPKNIIIKKEKTMSK